MRRSNQGFSDTDIAAYRHESDRGRDLRLPRRLKHDDSGRLLRSPPNPRDARLSDLALVWLHRLQADLRPLTLCEQFPRIANRLALCWDDHALTAKVFEELMADRRGNRRGFPADVKRELHELYKWSARGNR